MTAAASAPSVAPDAAVGSGRPTSRPDRRSRELTVVVGAAAYLPSTTLQALTVAAALQTRVDRKYLISAECLVTLTAHLADRLHVLEIHGRRQFRYESVYFDTADLLLYRHHLQGRRLRYKVRTRTYLDSGDCMFEVKFKGRRGQTVKARMPYDINDRHRMTPDAQAFLADLLDVHYRITPPALLPLTTISYTRTTLVDFAGLSRPTLDVDLRCSHRGRTVHGRGNVLVETKSSGPDSAVDRVLRRLGARPVKLSKYSLAVAALSPDVPANPLHRTMRRHFGWQPARYETALAEDESPDGPRGSVQRTGVSLIKR